MFLFFWAQSFFKCAILSQSVDFCFCGPSHLITIPSIVSFRFCRAQSFFKGAIVYLQLFVGFRFLKASHFSIFNFAIFYLIFNCLFSVFSGPFIFKGAIFAKVPFLQRCHFCKVPLFVCSTVCFRFFGFKLFVLGGSQLFLYFFSIVYVVLLVYLCCGAQS